MGTEAESVFMTIIYSLITVHSAAVVTAGGATVAGISDTEVF